MEVTSSISQLFSLVGKRALITGATGGIGQAIAGRFAEARAALELIDLRSTVPELA
jgi:NAD(P)-dependent dehydrogenase (short-subunit alcohol dehydrogenase family)